MTDADLIRAGRARAYRSWQSMHYRCSSTYPKRKYYFDRGIAICERWASFENFFADMGPRPAGMTIDREDNDKGYEPSNCRWATQVQQQRNRSDNALVTHEGVTRTLSGWAEVIGVRANTLKSRRAKGISASAILDRNVKPRNRYLEHEDKRLSIVEWAKVLGLTRGQIKDRLRRGWSVERALTTTAAEAARRKR